MTTEDRPTVQCWYVPVDRHVTHLNIGRIVHVDARHHPDMVEVWSLTTDLQPTRLIAIATGQRAPEGAEHIGTALSPATDTEPRGRFVWHLWRLP